MKTIYENGRGLKYIKNTLGRFGFTPNGLSYDMWGFHFIDTERGWYDITVYLDENECELGEYRLTAVAAPKVDDAHFDETFSTLQDLIDTFKKISR